MAKKYEAIKGQEMMNLNTCLSDVRDIVANSQALCKSVDQFLRACEAWQNSKINSMRNDPLKFLSDIWVTSDGRVYHVDQMAPQHRAAAKKHMEEMAAVNKANFIKALKELSPQQWLQLMPLYQRMCR